MCLFPALFLTPLDKSITPFYLKQDKIRTVSPVFLCKSDDYAILCVSGISLPLCGRGGGGARFPVIFF